MPEGRKSSTELLYGKARWCKLFTPSQYNKWSLELNLDEPSLGKMLELKKLGIRNQIKKDDDGYWVTISRNAELNIEGKLRPNAPPIVVDKDGQPWDKDKGIGNGSDVVVKVLIRKYRVPATKAEGIAVKLEAVKILNLVQFDLNKDLKDAEFEQAKGIAEATPQPW